MKYIEREDLIEIIQERFLDDSVALDESIIDGLETKAIDFAISYISGRYNTGKIFGNPVIRNEILVQAISMIVVYRAVRRNAARKVPDDFPDMYNEAKDILRNIQTGEQKLDGMPEITGETGTSGSLMYGNSTNKDFFI